MIGDRRRHKKTCGYRHGDRRRLSFISLFLLLSSSLFLFSCGAKRQTFQLEGTFKGFNQGELYIYGVNGTYPLDTIGIAKGHFRYEVALEEPTTFVIVFPNFSELPVFGTNKASVKMNGDVSHLREMKIEGTKENEEMTDFRRKTSQQMPPELARSTAQFIKDHPTTPFATYLIYKHFIQIPQPDYKTAIELLEIVKKANPDKQELSGLSGIIQKMKGLKNLKDGGQLPTFSAIDINGNTVKSSDLNAKVNVITVWSNWNYESVNLQRQLQMKQKKYGDDLKILSVCLDADVKECRRRVTRDSIKWSNICDGRAWETPVLRQIGLFYVPDNIITDNKGKIISHTLSNRELMTKIENLLPETP